MIRLDRYVLSQFLIMFGFFSLVLVAIFWINKAVVLFERLISDGQSALVFLEFTALGLPNLISLVMPIATFAATVYVTNRLSNESELIVMQATGFSPYRLARPVLMFGLIIFVFASALHHFLLPLAKSQLSVRESEISQDATARLLTDGAFLNPASGLTLYTGEIRDDGVLRDVFLSDRRSPTEEVTYTADQAYLIGDGDASKVLMLDGLSQRLDLRTNQISTTNFRDFSFDISSLVSDDVVQAISPDALTSLAFLTDWQDLSERTGRSMGALAEEMHGRFAEGLFCVAAALVGFSTLLIGGYSRFGIWRETALAFFLLLLLDGARSALRDTVEGNAALWPLIYLPAATGMILAYFLLWYTARPSRVPGSAAQGAAA